MLSYMSAHRDNTGTIEVAGGIFLEYKGKGSCLVYSLYSDSTTSIVRLINVLYIPTLSYNFISWNMLQNRFLCLMGGNHMYVKVTRDASQMLILHRLFHRHLLLLDKSKPNAFLTSSKPAFHTELSVSKSNTFTKSKPSTNLTALSSNLTAPYINLMASSTSFMALSTTLMVYFH